MALGLGVVFDLDDTLYLERQYVASGFRCVARLLGRSLGIGPDLVYAHLMELLRQGQRGRTFDLLIERFPTIGRLHTVQDLVDTYRKHRPHIRLLPGMSALLHSLRQAGVRLGLVSDGNLASQTVKVDALQLDSLLDLIVLTDTWGKEFWKPHPRGFERVQEVWNLHGSALVYVGDNPAKDFVAPKRMGWRTVRLRLPGQLHFEDDPPGASFAPEIEVRSVTELTEVLLS